MGNPTNLVHTWLCDGQVLDGLHVDEDGGRGDELTGINWVPVDSVVNWVPVDPATKR